MSEAVDATADAKRAPRFQDVSVGNGRTEVRVTKLFLDRADMMPSSRAFSTLSNGFCVSAACSWRSPVVRFKCRMRS